MNDYQWMGEHRDKVVSDHDTAARILNLSAEQLSQYATCEFIPSVEVNPGRGGSREYTFAHMLTAAITVELARYGMRLTQHNRDAIAEIVKWIFDTQGGQIDPQMIGKVAYFSVSFDENGNMSEVRPQYSERIWVRIGQSAVVVVITNILVTLLEALRKTEWPA